MNSTFSLEAYKAYYGSTEFQHNLMSWFDLVLTKTTPQYLVILNARRQFNRIRKASVPASTREKSFYFSFCIFFHSLQSQAIFKLSGLAEMKRFLVETGVPQFQCGMGGIMHPGHMLLEAELYPRSSEVRDYIKMLDTITPALRPQVEELSTYAPADQLYAMIEEEINAFKHRLEKNEDQPSYLITDK